MNAAIMLFPSAEKESPEKSALLNSTPETVQTMTSSGTIVGEDDVLTSIILHAVSRIPKESREMIVLVTFFIYK